MMPDTKYYDADLAAIHHESFGQLAEQAAGLLISLLGERTPAHCRVIDLGCGSGITARRLSERGCAVTGVDISDEMLELARQYAPNAEFVQASLFDYDIPPCDAVLAVGEPINYLFDEKSNLENLDVLFRKIWNALYPGGYLVFDLLLVGTVGTPEPQKRVVEHPDWTLFITLQEDFHRHTLSREIIAFRRVGELYRKTKETHWQQLYKGDDIQLMLQDVGFEVVQAPGYGELTFRRGHVGFVCRKP